MRGRQRAFASSDEGLVTAVRHQTFQRRYLFRSLLTSPHIVFDATSLRREGAPAPDGLVEQRASAATSAHGRAAMPASIPADARLPCGAVARLGRRAVRRGLPRRASGCLGRLLAHGSRRVDRRSGAQIVRGRARQHWCGWQVRFSSWWSCGKYWELTLARTSSRAGSEGAKAGIVIASPSTSCVHTTPLTKSNADLLLSSAPNYCISISTLCGS